MEYLTRRQQEIQAYKNTKFEDRMWNVYLGAMGNNMPPRWQGEMGILRFILHDESEFLLEENPHRWNEGDRNRLSRGVDEWDDHAFLEVISDASSYGAVIDPASNYFHHFRFSYMFVDDQDRTRFINPPWEEVW